MSDDKVQERPFGGFSESSGYEGGLQDGAYYNATVTGLVERYIEKGQWPGWKVLWTFAIDGATETVEAMTSQATGPDSTAGPWLIALVGKARYDTRKESPIAPTEVIGRECLILIAFNEKGWPRVSAVLPRQQLQPASPALVQSPPPAPGPVPTAYKASDFDELPF